MTRRFVPIVLTSLLLAGPALADDLSQNADGIAYHYVARVKLDFIASTGVVYGYLTAVSGVNSTQALFNGTPSEATAYLTFRADIKFQVLPGNGGIVPTLVEAGTWSVYYTASPAHSWDQPDTFSNGRVVAVMDRPVEQFSTYPTFAINAGAADVRSSSLFRLGGQVINWRALIPRGVVDVTSGSPVALPGSTATSPIFAVAGYGLAGR